MKDLDERFLILDKDNISNCLKIILTFTNNYHLRRNISINWFSANFFSKRAVNVYFHLIKRHSRDKFVAII